MNIVILCSLFTSLCLLLFFYTDASNKVEESEHHNEVTNAVDTYNKYQELCKLYKPIMIVEYKTNSHLFTHTFTLDDYYFVENNKTMHTAVINNNDSDKDAISKLLKVEANGIQNSEQFKMTIKIKDTIPDEEIEKLPSMRTPSGYTKSFSKIDKTIKNIKGFIVLTMDGQYQMKIFN